jgi:hypothetical protein
MLLPPLPPEATRGGVEPGSRWCEHFDSVEALARRLLALEQGLDTDVAKKDLPKEERQRVIENAAAGKRDLAELEKLRKDDLRYHRGGNHAGLLLRVQGPRDGEPKRYDHHTVVLRALRAISPAVPPSGATSGVSSEGFVINPDSPILVERQVVEAVVGAMLRRPLVLLAGVSGSGKTQLAKRLGKAWAAGLFHGRGKGDTQPFAPAQKWLVTEIMLAFEQVGFIKPADSKALNQWILVYELTEPPAAKQPAIWRSRYAFTAVKSDWTEASHLWGYHVPLPAEAEGFYATSTLHVFLRAHKAWHARTDNDKEAMIPHFVLLDEMNLSRPEHFASDLLSAMEVQLGSEGQSAAVIELHRAGAEVALRGSDASEEQRGVPASIGWAPGVCVIGTVNVDETTFSFAPKVLDRVALLEFTDVNLDVMFAGKRYKGGTYDSVYATHRGRFEAIQLILTPHNLHLAYRAAEEILAALSSAGDSANRANQEWDHQLCHKVLPRIRGPRASVEELLLALRSDAKLCNIQLSDGDRENIERGKLPNYVEANVDRRGWARRSVRKIDQMLMRAWTTGFTSYFG